MTIKTLKGRDSGASTIARTLDVTEGAVRYHLCRQAARAVDGRGGDTTATSALLDRLLHHAHVVQCGPKSYRMLRRSRETASA